MKRWIVGALILLAVLGVSTSLVASEKEKIYHEMVPAQLVRVYDGDTIFVNVPSWPAVVGENISIRVWGIDAREMKGGGGGESAKESVKALLADHDTVYLVNVRRDKYFRLLADVLVLPEMVLIRDFLLKKGLAREYYGEKKEEWEKEEKP